MLFVGNTEEANPLLQVLNKYYPPDFDPELIPRNKKPRELLLLCLALLCLPFSFSPCFGPYSDLSLEDYNLSTPRCKKSTHLMTA